MRGSGFVSLIAGVWLLGSCAHGSAPATPAVSVDRGIIRASEGQRGIDVAAYAEFTNRGDGDAVIAADCACAARIELHKVRDEGGQRRMTNDWPLALPAVARAEIAPGSPHHFMLLAIPAPIVPGQRYPVRFHLRSGTTITAEFIGVSDSAQAWRAADTDG